MTRRDEFDVFAMIGARLPRLSPRERDVGQHILDDPKALTGITINEMAKRVGSSEATVTRFCRSLGLRGYAELRDELAVASARLAARDTPESGWALLGELSESASISDIIAKVGYTNSQACKLTAELVDPASVNCAVRLLRPARRILVFGVGASAIVAADAAYKLQLSGLAAQSSADIHASLMWTSLFDAGDVVLVMTHSGRTREAIELIEDATSHGASTIVVTSDQGSPAARAADVKLMTAANEGELRSGGVAARIAALTVVDCLFVAMSHSKFDEALKEGSLMHDAVRDHLVEPEEGGD